MENIILLTFLVVCFLLYVLRRNFVEIEKLCRNFVEILTPILHTTESLLNKLFILVFLTIRQE